MLGLTNISNQHSEGVSMTLAFVDHFGRPFTPDEKKPTQTPQVETVPELSLDEIAAQEAQRQSTPKKDTNK